MNPSDSTTETTTFFVLSFSSFLPVFCLVIFTQNHPEMRFYCPKRGTAKVPFEVNSITNSNRSMPTASPCGFRRFGHDLLILRLLEFAASGPRIQPFGNVFGPVTDAGTQFRKSRPAFQQSPP